MPSARVAWRVALLAFGVGSVLAFAVVSLTINASAPLDPFAGWLVVLQKGRPSDSQVRVVVSRSAANTLEKDRQPFVYSIAACGSEPFRGALLIGGDARLPEVHVIAPPAPVTGPEPTAPGMPLSATRDIKFLSVAEGTYVFPQKVQIIRLALPRMPCAGRPSAEVEAPFIGAASVIEGRRPAGVEHRATGPFGQWEGPQSSQSWPYVGGFPELDPRNLGEFKFVEGLRGSWTIPRSATYVVEGGSIPRRTSIDLATPQTTASTTLAWEGRKPYAATALFTDGDDLGQLQTWLTFVSIWLGLGGSVLVSLAIERNRRSEAPQRPAPPRELRRGHSGWLPAVVLFVVAGALLRLASRAIGLVSRS
jgi:hypothetical protein